MDRAKRLRCDMYLKRYAIENYGFCREWFCAQANVTVVVGALHTIIEELERQNRTQMRGLCRIGELRCCGQARNRRGEN